MEHARKFYEAYGGKTIILARFLPIIRTFAPILAGVGVMRYTSFLFYNVIGGIIWAIGMPALGYFLGSVIPDVDRYLLPIIIAIIILSLLPTLWHIFKEKEYRDYIFFFFFHGKSG